MVALPPLEHVGLSYLATATLSVLLLPVLGLFGPHANRITEPLAHFRLADNLELTNFVVLVRSVVLVDRLEEAGQGVTDADPGAGDIDGLVDV